MDLTVKDRGKTKVLELKKIAKQLDQRHRNDATERRFIACLQAILTNSTMMDDLQNDIDCLCDITKVLCNVCAEFNLLAQLLDEWLQFLKHIPSQTKYTIFLVMDIEEFRKCAKVFFVHQSSSEQSQIVTILCSYLDGNKPKMTDCLKQLFHCIIPTGALDKMPFYCGNGTDYVRYMVDLINKYATLADNASQDSPDGIVESTFYGDSENQALEATALEWSKKSVDGWQLIHSSDDEDSSDDHAPIAVVTPVPTKPIIKNVEPLRSPKFKCPVVRIEKGHETKKPLLLQGNSCVEEKPKRKRKSAQIAKERAKKQLIDEVIDLDELEKNVYDFNDDDSEPRLKKKRRVAQPKKRKKPAPWPRVEQKKVEKPSQKLYTIRVKKAVGSQAKAMVEKAETPRPIGPKQTKNTSKVAVTASDSNVTELSIHSPELLMDETDWSINDFDGPVIESKISMKTMKKAVQESKKPPPISIPLGIPLQIIANIGKINETVKMSDDNRPDYGQSKRKPRSKNVAATDSSKESRSKKKPQPRKLYTEFDSEFDGIDMEQVTTAKVSDSETVTETTKAKEGETNTKKNQIEKNVQRADITSSHSNTSRGSNDDMVAEINESAIIKATSSCCKSLIKTEEHCDASQNDSFAMPDSTNNSIGITEFVPLSTETQVETIDTNDESFVCLSHSSDSKQSRHISEIVQQLKIASTALCNILSILDQSGLAPSCRCKVAPDQQQLCAVGR